MLFFWTFYSSNNPEKNIMILKKTWSSTTVFSNDSNIFIYFFSSKSVYYNDFWRSRDTEDWSNDAENTAAHHRNKLDFNINQNRKF